MEVLPHWPASEDAGMAGDVPAMPNSRHMHCLVSLDHGSSMTVSPTAQAHVMGALIIVAQHSPHAGLTHTFRHELGRYTW